MATKSRWDKSNWSEGPVTFFSALGIKGNIKLPTLQTSLANSVAALTGGSTKTTQNPGGGNTNAPASKSQADWAKAILGGIGAPSTQANVNSLVSWFGKESSWNASPPDGALYTNNPLNTTQPGFNATGNVNSVGVKIYPTSKDGVAATVHVLLNGNYAMIVARLRQGQGLCGWSSGEFSTWSGGGYSSVC